MENILLLNNIPLCVDLPRKDAFKLLDSKLI